MWWCAHVNILLPGWGWNSISWQRNLQKFTHACQLARLSDVLFQVSTSSQAFWDGRTGSVPRTVLALSLPLRLPIPMPLPFQLPLTFEQLSRILALGELVPDGRLHLHSVHLGIPRAPLQWTVLCQTRSLVNGNDDVWRWFEMSGCSEMFFFLQNVGRFLHVRLFCSIATFSLSGMLSASLASLPALSLSPSFSSSSITTPIQVKQTPGISTLFVLTFACSHCQTFFFRSRREASIRGRWVTTPILILRIFSLS